MPKKVYTFTPTGGETQVISRKDFIKILAERVCYDTDKVTDLISIDVANYKKAEAEANKLAYGTVHGLLVCGVGFFKVSNERSTNNA